MSIFPGRPINSNSPPTRGCDVGAAPLGRKTILLVEDEVSVRELEAEMLRTVGYLVYEAADGVEAVEFADGYDGTIDLLLTDVSMPHMNGAQLREHIVRQRPEIKVLFASGYDENVALQEGLLAPHVDFLAKPFTIEALTDRVRRMLDRPQ